MTRSPGLVTVILGSVIASAACGGGRDTPPPSPTTSFEPVIVSLVAAVDRDATIQEATLSDGSRLRLDETNGRLLNGDWEVVPGDLLLADSGTAPTWWAALPTKNVVHPSGAAASASVPDGRCWLIRGGAYDEGDAIHFSSGLRLPKAAEFKVAFDWIKDPFPARGSDSFCVDRDATVTSLDFIWVGGY
jgi:hypothetical protein